MPTLRDRVGEALAKDEPNATEARADLNAVLVRARGRSRAALLAWGFAIAAVLFVFVSGWMPRATAPPPPRREARGAVHLYLHVAGEPEERALALDLTAKGDLR